MTALHERTALFDALRGPAEWPGDLVESLARVIYAWQPVEESGEAIDGFQVTPPGLLSWHAAVEAGADEPYRAAARAALVVLMPGGA